MSEDAGESRRRREETRDCGAPSASPLPPGGDKAQRPTAPPHSPFRTSVDPLSPVAQPGRAGMDQFFHGMSSSDPTHAWRSPEFRARVPLPTYRRVLAVKPGVR